MKSLFLATYFLILRTWNCNVYAETDPCSEDVYRILPRAAYRGGACQYNSDKETCDAALITSWYRAVANGKDLQMQEKEASLLECGTKWPFYMIGTHPQPNEGIVNRTLIQAWSSEMKTIQVKNCQDEYYVYYLHPTAACPEAYCFGETQNDTCPPFDPCDIYEHQKIDYNPEQSSYCISSSDGTCSTPYDKDWVTFRDRDYNLFLNVSSRPVRSGACGSQTPVWIKDVESTDGDGVQTIKLCLGSETSNCERTVTARAKDCRWFTVYEIPKEMGFGHLCLEDPSASCANLPVSKTKETPAATTTTEATKSLDAQSTKLHATTTHKHDDLIKNVTAGSMPVSSTGTSVQTSSKYPLSTQSSDDTTEQGESKTRPNAIQDKPTGLLEDDQHVMVIAVAVTVSVVAIVILVVVIVAFRRRCLERHEKLQRPDPDDHYYLHVAEPIPPETEKGKDNNQVENQYADIQQVYVNAQ